MYMYMCVSIECALPETCFMDDFVTQQDYHHRQLLGHWHMVARQISSDRVVFHSAEVLNTYVDDHNINFKIIGQVK